MKEHDLRAHNLKDFTLPIIIQLEIDAAEFWMEEGIYPDDIQEEERANIDRLRRLQKRKQFSADDVHFLIQRIAGACESNADIEHMKVRLGDVPPPLKIS